MDSNMNFNIGLLWQESSFDDVSGTTGAPVVNTPAYLERRYRWLVAYRQDILKDPKEQNEKDQDTDGSAEVKADCVTDAQLLLQQDVGEDSRALMSLIYGVSSEDVFVLCKSSSSSSSSTNEFEAMMNAKLTVFFLSSIVCNNNYKIIEVIDMYANMHRKVLSEGGEEPSMMPEELTAAFKDLIKVAMRDPTIRPTDEDVDWELEANYLEFLYVMLESEL